MEELLQALLENLQRNTDVMGILAENQLKMLDRIGQQYDVMAQQGQDIARLADLLEGIRDAAVMSGDMPGGAA